MNHSPITLITLEYPPDRGGIARYLGYLVAASEGAIRVIVPEGATTDGHGKVDKAVFFRKQWPTWFPLIRICRSLSNSSSTLLAGRSQGFAHTGEGGTSPPLRTPILLVSHAIPVGTAAWISRMLGGPEYAVIFHGTDIKRVEGVWKRWLLNRICRNAKAVFTNSRATTQDLRNIVTGIEVTVLTPGVSKEKYLTREEARTRLGIGPDEPLVVSVCRLVPRKGVDFSLRAISRLQTHMPVRYVVIGNGPDLERLEQVAKESRTVVTWVLDANDEEMRAWLAAADVFCLPGRNEKWDVEGFGISYLEAAAAGVPSVAGRSGGVAEAVVDGNTGFIVDPDSIQDIAEAVEKLLKQSKLRKQLGENAKSRVLKDFRWEDRWAVLISGLND